jgi:hypothetical protein
VGGHGGSPLYADAVLTTAEIVAVLSASSPEAVNR